jgi:hypothetical protein
MFCNKSENKCLKSRKLTESRVPKIVRVEQQQVIKKSPANQLLYPLIKNVCTVQYMTGTYKLHFGLLFCT